jgi:uncharacterized repeat protein (TIGR03803 family)
LTNLYSFTGGNDGSFPRGALVQGTNGDFYGTTERDGAETNGTIFEISPTGVFTILHSFTGWPRDGAYPGAGLILGSDGNYYGTTSGGGLHYQGTIFQMSPAGVVSNIYSFTGGIDGSSPYAPLAQGRDGQLYGTTLDGGDTTPSFTYGYGAIFKITLSGVLTPLYAFTDELDGESPSCGLVQGFDGNFYGSAIHGTTGDGALFQITPAGGFTVLYNFSGPDGSGPIGGLIQASDTNFYGTTLGGGTDDEGTVFQLDTNGVLTTLYSFTNGPDGAEPYASLIQGADGNLYGTTIGSDFDMPHSSGSIFQITTNGTLTALYTFPGSSDGATPAGGLTVGNDGNLYGTTISGGTNGDGTIFELALEGSFRLLHSFTGVADGATPSGALAQGSDGNFYGADGNEFSALLPQPGAAAYGTVFKTTPAGSFTVLHTFTDGSDGGLPLGGLTLGIDGNFYGTSETGGANGKGNVFTLNSSGLLTNLYSFTGGSDGGSPEAALVQANDTNFYGTTTSGGSGYGTLFKISPEGAFTMIQEFSGGNSSGPFSPLVLATNGSLYGCASGEAGDKFGVIFKVTPPNAYTVLYTFTNGIDGEEPRGGLVQGSDGIFYGTTSGGGPNGNGVVFKMTTGGNVQALYAFSAVDDYGFNQDGANPSTTLVQAGDGNFYGTAEYGGPYGSGTIFRVAIIPTPPPVFLPAAETGGALVLTWSAEYGSSYQLQSCTNLSQPIWTHLGAPISAAGSTAGESNPTTGEAQRFYRVILLP